jgi:FkbM family methyltransferase
MPNLSIDRIIRAFFRRIMPLISTPDPFLKECRAIIHVGANKGDERDIYAKRDLRVLWIEALPEVFGELTKNLESFPKQKAVRSLVTAKDGESHDFNVSDHGGVSSSVFNFSRHGELWPEIKMTKSIRLTSKTLATILREEHVSPKDFDALIMDVQGAELLVLQGAGDLLSQIRFIQAETSNCEVYAQACTLEALTAFLSERGFQIRHKERFAWKPGIGSCFNVLYERRV